MDIDAYATARSQNWARLAELSGHGRLDGQQADELIELYQEGATDLSVLKTQAGSTLHGDRLSVSLSRARIRFTGTGVGVLAQLPQFFLISLPAALYRLRWITLIIALATLATAALFVWWTLSDPRVLANYGSQAQLKQLANHAFTSYYSDNPAASFTGQVWTNNAWIAAQCIAFGIIGIYVPAVLLQNAANIGIDAAVLFHFNEGATFFAYILPHGMLELTSIFVAGAAGMKIFWAWIAPGARTRGQALAEDGRALFTVAVGCACSLLISGLIEGFVTPSPLPVWAKMSIGGLALAAYLFYMIVIGGRAARAGATGDLDEFEAGATQLVAA